MNGNKIIEEPSVDDYLNHSTKWFRMITKIEFLRIRNDAIKHCEELKAEILKDKCHTGLTHPLHPLYMRYNEIVKCYTRIHGVVMDITPEENRARRQYEKEYCDCFTEKIAEDEENYGHGILVCNECNQEFLLYRKAIDHYTIEHREEEAERKKKKDDERALAREDELRKKETDRKALIRRKKLADKRKKERMFAERASNEMEKKLIRIELLKKKRIEDEIKEDMCLKPWKDPDSLFCDTEFLEKPVEEGGLGIKDIRTGDDCKK